MKSDLFGLASIAVLVQLVPSFVFAQDSLTLQIVSIGGSVFDIPMPTADATAVPVSTIDGGAATVYEIADNRPGKIQTTETITASASGWTISADGTDIKCQKNGDTEVSCAIHPSGAVGSNVDIAQPIDIVLPIATGAGSSGSNSASGSNHASGNTNNINNASLAVGMRVGLGAVLSGLAIGGFMLI
ncbi:hypothetical protein VKT23_009994 [Stygiomarasmius scandens]|uniref:Uncharacterized protein n=1 Tax=Marasmiellus scandens TaxID=2682957 RepID=A0ABR1JDK7_9AGAR